MSNQQPTQQMMLKAYPSLCTYANLPYNDVPLTSLTIIGNQQAIGRMEATGIPDNTISRRVLTISSKREQQEGGRNTTIYMVDIHQPHVSVNRKFPKVGTSRILSIGDSICLQHVLHPGVARKYVYKLEVMESIEDSESMKDCLGTTQEIRDLDIEGNSQGGVKRKYSEEVEVLGCSGGGSSSSSSSSSLSSSYSSSKNTTATASAQTKALEEELRIEKARLEQLKVDTLEKERVERLRLETLENEIVENAEAGRAASLKLLALQRKNTTEMFECALCCGLILNATCGANCLHLFCKGCITPIASGTNSCPECRESLGGVAGLKGDGRGDQMLEMNMMQGRLEDDQVEDYLERRGVTGFQGWTYVKGGAEAAVAPVVAAASAGSSSSSSPPAAPVAAPLHLQKNQANEDAKLVFNFGRAAPAAALIAAVQPVVNAPILNVDEESSTPSNPPPNSSTWEARMRNAQAAGASSRRAAQAARNANKGLTFGGQPPEEEIIDLT